MSPISRPETIQNMHFGRAPSPPSFFPSFPAPDDDLADGARTHNRDEDAVAVSSLERQQNPLSLLSLSLSLSLFLLPPK